ncbi:hypothetical protein [Gordonia zhaorongruii]|uniref:hypothetical protein n=1 Tax=Gordonia zhaorongruii TaxID=2597659 RepID=UPI00117F3383|nr:hypothetical protein [Gordonia zhaorongruii]
MTRLRNRPPADRRRLTSWAVVVVLALVVALIAGVLALRASAAPERPDSAPAEAAAAAVRTLMTFSPEDGAGRRAETRASLTGPLAADYALRGPDVVFPSAVASRVTMSVEVTDAGVTSATDGSARVLVFADQTIVVGAHRESPSRIGVARWAWMTRVDDEWLLARLGNVSPQ